MPRTEVVDGQSAMFLATATVLIRGARNCTVERCEIAPRRRLRPLEWERGSKDNRVVQCHIHDLGAGGVRLGEQSLPAQPRRATRAQPRWSNCFIHDGGHVYHMGAAPVDRPKLLQQGAAQRDLRLALNLGRVGRLELGIRAHHGPS
jgi:hypothetical protein